MVKVKVCKWERWSSFFNQWICEYQKYDDGNCPYPELMCNYKIERLISQKFIEKLFDFVEKEKLEEVDCDS